MKVSRVIDDVDLNSIALGLQHENRFLDESREQSLIYLCDDDTLLYLTRRFPDLVSAAPRFYIYPCFSDAISIGLASNRAVIGHKVGTILWLRL